MIEISDDINRINTDDLIHLYKTISLRDKLKDDDIKTAVSGSTYLAFAIDNNKVIGAVRVISDNIEWTYISDVTVLPKYSDSHTKKELIKKVLQRFRGHEIFVVSDVKSLETYEELGFLRSKNAFTYEGYSNDFYLKQPKEEYYLPIGFEYEIEHFPFAGSFPVGKKSKIDLSNKEVRLSKDLKESDYLRINELLSKAYGGSGRDLDITKKAFDNSRYFAFAYVDDRLVGCARAVSDSKFQAMILNVAVDPDYQGLHIGQKAVDYLCSQMKGQNIYLNTHPGGVGFYNRKPYLRNKTALFYLAHPDMPEEIAKGFVLQKGYRFLNER